MPDQNRWRVEPACDVFHVRFVIIQAGDEQHARAAACAVTPQTERVRRVAARGEPGQEIGLPAPLVAISAVDEKKRRLSRRRRRQTLANFQKRLSGEHGRVMGAGSKIEWRRSFGSEKAKTVPTSGQWDGSAAWENRPYEPRDSF